MSESDEDDIGQVVTKGDEEDDLEVSDEENDDDDDGSDDGDISLGDEGDFEGDDSSEMEDVETVAASSSISSSSSKHTTAFGAALSRILNKPLPDAENVIGSVAKRKVADDEALKAKREAKKLKQEKRKRKLMKRQRLEKGHVLPQHDPFEKTMLKIATKGVVTLFNAVSQQQKTISKEEADKTKKGKEKQQALADLRGPGFLEVLKSTAAAPTPTISSRAKKDNKQWKVLSENYMMGAKMKDWEKPDSDEDDPA